MLKLTERIVSRRRHTIGYVLDGSEYTRRETVKLAKQKQVKNVRVVNNRHIVGDGIRLYDLPIRFGLNRRFSSLRSK